MATDVGEKTYQSHTSQEIDDAVDAIAAEITNRTASDTVQNSALAYLIDSGAKNRFPIPKRIGTNNSNATQTYTQAGVKFTCNLDGTITVERTSTSSSQAQLWLYGDSSAILIDDYCDGSYVFSTGFEGSGDTARMVLAKLDNGSEMIVNSYVSLPDKGTQSSINVSIRVSSTFTGSVTVKPMVCKKAAWDVSQVWVPYTPTYAELYAMVVS